MALNKQRCSINLWEDLVSKINTKLNFNFIWPEFQDLSVNNLSFTNFVDILSENIQKGPQNNKNDNIQQ